MIVGILSDTHGRVAAATAAVDLLVGRGAEFVIHCGDVGDGVVACLPAGRSAFVFGNTDWDARTLLAEAAHHDVRCLRAGGVVDLAGTRVAVTHGDEPKLVNAYLAAKVDYLLTGHTHVAHDRTRGATREINPGALHRATRKTVATLDLKTGALTFHEVGIVTTAER